MKKIFFTMAIASAAMIVTAKAQVSIGVSIGTPAPVYAAPMAAAPVWVPQGPASPYYFFPDINCYYDMALSQYIYFENNRWIYANALPPRFRGYDFRRGRVMPMSRADFGYRGIPRYNAGPRGMMPRGGMMAGPAPRGNNFAMGRPQMNRGQNYRGGHMDGGKRGGNYGEMRGGRR